MKILFGPDELPLELLLNSVLEAMHCGKVVLASSIEGNKTIIKDGFNGLLFKNKGEFFEKALSLIADKNLRMKLSNKAKEILDKEFSYGDEVSNYLEVYNSV